MNLLDTLIRMPRTVMVGIVAGGRADFIGLQAAVDYCDNEGGDWTIEVYTGVNYVEGDITPNGGANITIKGMGTDRVVIRPAGAPTTAVIVSGFTLHLDNITVTAPDATRPALRVTGGTLECCDCVISGFGAGDAIQQVGGTLHLNDSDVPVGDVDLSTGACTLTATDTNFGGTIDTAGAFGHSITFFNCDLGNQALNLAATGDCSYAFHNCMSMSTITDASLNGTGHLCQCDVVGAGLVVNGTSAWIVDNAGVVAVSNTNAAATVAIYVGIVLAITRAIGSVVWWQDGNTLKVVPSGTTTDTMIGWALTAAVAGDVVLLHPGLYDESVTCVTGVDLKGVGPKGSAVIQQTDATIITTATNVELDNFTVRLVTPSAHNRILITDAGVNTVRFTNLVIEVTTPAAWNNWLFRLAGAGDYSFENCTCSVGGTGVSRTLYVDGAAAIHFLNNDFEHNNVNARHIETSAACTLTGGGNRWAGTGHMFSVTLGTITLDNEAVVCTGMAAGDVTGGTVLLREGHLEYEVYPGMMIQHALTAGAGGEVLIHAGAYAPTANLTISADTLVHGAGLATVITPTGALITHGIVIGGDNVILRDMKVIIAAGAGAGTTRPNVIYAATRTKVTLENLWIVGDNSVADDGSDARQNGINFVTVTDSIIQNCIIEDTLRSAIGLWTNSNYIRVLGNKIDSHTRVGIYVYNGAQTSNWNTISKNQIDATGNGFYQIQIENSDHNSIEGNTIVSDGSTWGAIYVDTASYNEVVGNIIDNVSEGIYSSSAPNNTFANNLIDTSAGEGLYLDGDYCVVTGNHIRDATDAGIRIEGRYCVVTGNLCEGSTGGEGIWITNDNNIVSGNTCQNNNLDGIFAGGAECAITGNFCHGNAQDGIYLNAAHITVTGNVLSDNAQYGISVSSSADDSVINSNICYNNDTGGNTYSGIYVTRAERCVVSGNQCSANGLHGIYIFRVGYCNVSGNVCHDQNTGDGINVTGDGSFNSDYNVITGNSCYGNASDGIEIAGGVDANYNSVKNNQLTGNGGLCLNDGGTNTQLAVHVVPFVDGSEPLDSGYLIDVATEYARAYLRLPPEVQQVLRMEVYARSVVLEADKMRLEMVVYGAADNENYQTHNGSVADLASISANFAADDIVFWRNVEAGVLAMLGGDSVEVKVLHEVAGNGDCATNAYFRTVEIQYV